jgi:signal transduction histidine kinase
MLLDPRFAAHDLRHLLGLVRGHAELLLADSEQASREPCSYSGLREIIYATDRAVEMCEDLLHFGHDLVPQRSVSISLASMLDTVRRLGPRRFHATEVQLIVEVPDFEALIPGDPAQLQRGLLNLVWNAMEAAPAEQGQVRLSAKRCDAGICFSVEDNGPGLPKAYLRDLTQLAPEGKGQWRSNGNGELHGFGLMIVAFVARIHGGQLLGDQASEGGGAALHLVLPAGR